MSCVVELPADTSDFTDEINDPFADDASHRLHIDTGNLEPGIPTFDASDVDHQLEKSQSQRLLRKSIIILGAYNPLPLLCLALVRAHTNDAGDPSSLSYRKRLSAADLIRHQGTALWDLEAQSSDDDHFAPSSCQDVLVNRLPILIQREFRDRVLQALLLYVGVFTIIVSTSTLCIPWAATYTLMHQSPYLFPVAQAGVGAIAILSLWLVYALRFDFPVNYAALAFLTLSEIACTVAYGVMNDPHKVVQAASLLLCGILLLKAFSSRAANDSDDELLCPAQAAFRSIVVLAAVAVLLSAAIGEQVTHTSIRSLIGLLAVVSLALLWISLVLTVLTQTMRPDEHASALVFFQADLVVLVVIEPTRVLLKCVRQCKRATLREDEEEELPANPIFRQNAVVQAFWPDLNQASPVRAAAANETHKLSYPAHLIPLRSREQVPVWIDPPAGVSDATPVVMKSRLSSPTQGDTSLNSASLWGPRRRNSTADD